MATIWGVDPTLAVASGLMAPLAIDSFVLIALIVILMPLAVLGGLAYSARLRGPGGRSESRKPVESLVTEAIPEDHPSEEEDENTGPEFRIDSPPPAPDPELRGRGRDGA